MRSLSLVEEVIKSFKFQLIVSMLELKVKEYSLVKTGQFGTLLPQDASLKTE